MEKPVGLHRQAGGADKKSFPELYARLLTIPSVGPKTALELIVITDGLRRFDDVKGLSAHVGVSPTTYHSGTSIKGKGGIDVTAHKRVRLTGISSLRKI